MAFTKYLEEGRERSEAAGMRPEKTSAKAAEKAREEVLPRNRMCWKRHRRKL